MLEIYRELAILKLVINNLNYSNNYFLFFTVRHQRIKFLVVGIENSLSIYAWAPRPYSKFMAFKVER